MVGVGTVATPGSLGGVMVSDGYRALVMLGALVTWGRRPNWHCHCGFHELLTLIFHMGHEYSLSTLLDGLHGCLDLPQYVDHLCLLS